MCLGTVAVLVLLRTLRGMYNSIGPERPTKRQLEEEDLDKCKLFRYVTALKGKIAWRLLRESDEPTPIHRVVIDGQCSFFVKREDLTSPVYGGNKVRTLEHQLACCEAFAERTKDPHFYVVGSAGSNQCVAATVHGLQKYGLQINSLYSMKDEADMDNTLNMLSVLSFPTKVIPWTATVDILRTVAFLATSKNSKVFNLGGNNMAGVLGQMGALFEFAEQIQNGEIPDPEGIILACGSFCTFTGLLIGITIAQQNPQLDQAFKHPKFKLRSVPIHHAMAKGIEKLDIFRGSIAAYVPLSPVFGINRVCEFIVDCGGPDYTQDCLSFLKNKVEFIADAPLIGTYGIHSDVSRSAAKLFEEKGSVLKGGERMSDLWLCGHFTAKPFAALLRMIEREKERDGYAGEFVHRDFVFWQTKSAVQPKGKENEFRKIQKIAKSSKEVHNWVQEGAAESVLRPGKVDLTKTPATYRHLMKEVEY